MENLTKASKTRFEQGVERYSVDSLLFVLVDWVVPTADNKSPFKFTVHHLGGYLGILI
jgi:hypothetical protein